MDLAAFFTADFIGVAAAFSLDGVDEDFDARDGLALAFSVSLDSAAADARAFAGFSFATFDGVGVAELCDLRETRRADESLALFTHIQKRRVTCIYVAKGTQRARRSGHCNKAGNSKRDPLQTNSEAERCSS